MPKPTDNLLLMIEFAAQLIDRIDYERETIDQNDDNAKEENRLLLRAKWATKEAVLYLRAATMLL